MREARRRGVVSSTYTITVSYERELPDLGPNRVQALVHAALAAEAVADGASVSVIFTDDATIHALNRQYRGVDRPTDVLSFGLSEMAAPDDEQPDIPGFVLPPDSVLELGEVVVSQETAARQAAEHGRALDHELAHLVVHGVLHLLGHDHAEPEEEARMRAREDEVLHACGFPSGSAGWDDAHD
jgi:probable rRNA maturation factor